MYETILLPTDGSEHSLRAAEHGRYLAELFDATVHVLNVVDVQAAGGPFNAGGLDEQFVSNLESMGEDAITAVESAVEGVTVRTAIERGEPAEAIVEYAEDNDVDLIAMGTHGRTGLERYITGSVTATVVRRAERPVLTVRATERSELGAYDGILVPTDGSEPATAAVEHALSIAERTGARVHAVNVVDVTALSLGPEYTMPTGTIDRLETVGEEATEAIATRARDRGLDAVTAVRQGSPAGELRAYADEHDLDLIAMATHGRTGLGRILLGSTTERLLRHAEIPVLAVHAGTDDA